MATYPEDQVRELAHFGTVTSGDEAGGTFFRIEGMQLPAGCSPPMANALLCPHARDGYTFRLYFSGVITGPITHNWNGQNTRILEENWFAFSLKVPEGLRLAEMVMTVVNALIKK